jgi:RND family efflux transporter MFP subunit
MFRKKKTYVILVLIVLIIGGIYYSRTKKPVNIYTTSDVERGDLKQTVAVTGKIVAPEEINLAFETGGKIDYLEVSVGDPVKENEIVAKLDRGSLNLQLIEAQTDIKIQRETLKAMQKKEDTYNKDQRDAQKHLIEKSQTAYDILVNQSKDLTLRAPFGGMVIRKSANQNEELEIETNIPESDIVKIKIGQKAEITLDALPSDEILEAEVQEIEPASTVIQEVVYYKVKLKLINKDERLRVGMSVDVDVSIFEKKDVVMASLRSIREEGSEKYVEILREDNVTTEKIKIKTGLEGDKGMIEVVSGLSGGEKVITSTNEK